MAVSLLNLDTSYPIEDSNHASNTSGAIRYVNQTDANGLQAMQRYMGDVQHRTNLMVAAINALTLSFNSNPYTSGFDDSGYVLTDGSHAFTEPVAGVTPTLPEHMAVKSYVDGVIEEFQTQVDDTNDRVTTLTNAMPLVRTSGWVEYVWSAGEKVLLQFTLAPESTDLTNLSLISIIERLNKGTSEEPNYIYMQHFAGSATNFRVDAMWLDDSSPNVVNVLVPNSVNYPVYPEDTGYSDIQDFSERHLKLVVTHSVGYCDVVV